MEQLAVGKLEKEELLMAYYFQASKNITEAEKRGLATYRRSRWPDCSFVRVRLVLTRMYGLFLTGPGEMSFKLDTAALDGTT